MNHYFLDTCSLLSLNPDNLDGNDVLLISNITLAELENIKTSAYKDDSTKYLARKALHWLNKHEYAWQLWTYRGWYSLIMHKYSLPKSNDSMIMACAIRASKKFKDVVFVTEDLACLTLAKSCNLATTTFTRETDTYCGYKEMQMNHTEMAEFYSDIIRKNINKYHLLTNEYLLIEDIDKKIVDKYRWDSDTGYCKVTGSSFESNMFGKISAYKGDDFQQCAIDSLKHNQVTLLGGPAGSGKTFLALGYLFSELEKGHINKILIFCNPVGAKDAAKLGFYKGTALEKILSSQVGHVLSSKLGGMDEVEQLIDDGMIEIIPAVDARGYEVPEHCGVYILESQNLTSDLLRMLLQRVGKNCKVIVDGDRLEQVDMAVYASDNGMKKMSKVFRGSSLYGQVDMKYIHRSDIALLADQMKY